MTTQLHASSFCARLLPLATFTFAILALATPGTAQDPQPQRGRAMAVHDLVGNLAPTPRLPFHTFIGLRHMEHWPSYVPDRQERVPVMESDELIEVLSQVDSTLEQDGTEVHIENGRVHMQGTAEQIQHIGELIGTIRDQFAAPITIDAAVIRHDGELSPPSILDPDQARAMFEGHEAAWRGTATTPQRMATHIGSHRAVSYVHTNTAHISEERFEALQMQDEMFDGVGMVAVAHRLATGTDLVLQAQFAVGKLSSISAFNTGLRDQPDLQRPTLATTAANISGRIRNGGALVFNAKASAASGGNVLVIVRASWTPSKAAVPENLLILPISSLTSPGAAMPSFSNTEHVALAMPDPDNLHNDNEPQEPLLQDDMLAEMLMNTVDPQAWDDGAQLNVFRGHLMVVGKPEMLKKVASFVVSQERQLLQTLEVSYTFGEGRITMPTLADRNHAVRHGVETTAASHSELEIAKKASIQTPVIVRLFDGIEFAVRPYALDKGLGARIDWFARRSESAPQGIGLPPIRLSARHHSGAIPSNGLAAGDGPLGKQAWHVRTH